MLTFLCFIAGDSSRVRADQLTWERGGSVQLRIFLESPLVGGGCFAAVSDKPYLRILSLSSLRTCCTRGDDPFFRGCWCDSRHPVLLRYPVAQQRTKLVHRGRYRPVCVPTLSADFWDAVPHTQTERACCSHPSRACSLFASQPCSLFAR
jgi:hypothetical protein